MDNIKCLHVRLLYSFCFVDSSQDGNGGATGDVTNQEAVYSQIKKFQVCFIDC